MSAWTLALVLIAIVAAVLWMRPGLPSIVDRAARTGEVGPLLMAIGKLKPAARPAAYNLAIRRLWDGWHRDLAAQVVRVLAADHAAEPVAQYWMRQVLTVEPDTAKRFLDDAFVDEHYNPAVAARCGPAG